jgi:hypothetical protein
LKEEVELKKLGSSVKGWAGKEGAKGLWRIENSDAHDWITKTKSSNLEHWVQEISFLKPN